MFLCRRIAEGSQWMMTVICDVRWLGFSLFLVAVGSAVYLIVPIEPRWQITLDGSHENFDAHWDLSAWKVRICPREKWKLHHGPTLVDIDDGGVDRRFVDLTEENLYYSPDERYAIGTAGSRIRWIDFAAGEQRFLSLDDAVKRIEFSPRGDHFLVVMGSENQETLQMAAFETASARKLFQTKIGWSWATFTPEGDNILSYPGAGNTLQFHALSGESKVLPMPIFDFHKYGDRVLGLEWREKLVTLWDLCALEGPKRLFCVTVNWDKASHIFDGRYWIIAPIDQAGSWVTQFEEVWDTHTGEKCTDHPGTVPVAYRNYSIEDREWIQTLRRDDRNIVLVGNYGERGFPALTPDKGFAVVHLTRGYRLRVLGKWAPQWLEARLANNSSSWVDYVSVWNMQSEKEVFSMYDRTTKSAALSPDGGTLLTSDTADDSRCLLTCWNVPGRKPWRWILGVPAALGVLLVAPYQARKRCRGRKRAAAVVAQPSEA